MRVRFSPQAPIKSRTAKTQRTLRKRNKNLSALRVLAVQKYNIYAPNHKDAKNANLRALRVLAVQKYIYMLHYLKIPIVFSSPGVVFILLQTFSAKIIRIKAHKYRSKKPRGFRKMPNPS